MNCRNDPNELGNRVIAERLSELVPEQSTRLVCGLKAVGAQTSMTDTLSGSAVAVNDARGARTGMAKSVATHVRVGRFWRLSHAAVAATHALKACKWQENAHHDTPHLEAAALWLERAQDAARDGGVAGRYRLASGWTSSYPETTGYVVPTLLALSDALGDERFQDRAARAVEFLLRIQLRSGAFPGLEIAENRTEPSPFNTAQIIHGLISWHEASRSQRALDAAVRAADWLLSIQDRDGAWRQHWYKGLPATYSAHASCWIAQLGESTGERRFIEGARQHLEWALSKADSETGWFDLAGFSSEHHDQRRSVTHTIAYTLWVC